MPIHDKLKAEGCIILAAPVHFGSANALTKGLMERAGCVVRNSGSSCNGKLGGPLVVGGRGRSAFTMAQMTCRFQTMESGVAHWIIDVGNDRVAVTDDKEGIDAARNVGKSLALMTQAVHVQPSGTLPLDTAGSRGRLRAQEHRRRPHLCGSFANDSCVRTAQHRHSTGGLASAPGQLNGAV